MAKKIISLILSAMMLLIILPASVSAQDETENSGDFNVPDVESTVSDDTTDDTASDDTDSDDLTTEDTDVDTETGAENDTTDNSTDDNSETTEAATNSSTGAKGILKPVIDINIDYDEVKGKFDVSDELIDENFTDNPKAFFVEVIWGDIDKSVSNSVDITTWDGSVNLEGGKMKLAERIKFEKNQDYILSKNGEAIEWQSKIKSAYDGILVKVKPDKDKELLFTAESDFFGKVSLTFEELKEGKIFEFDDDYKLSIRAIHPKKHKSKFKAKPMLLFIRWGNLSGSIDTEAQAIEYEGEITSDGVPMNLIHSVLFEENDYIIKDSANNIEFHSIIGGHFDGILLHVRPLDESFEDFDIEDFKVLKSEFQEAVQIQNKIKTSFGGRVQRNLTDDETNGDTDTGDTDSGENTETSLETESTTETESVTETESTDATDETGDSDESPDEVDIPEVLEVEVEAEELETDDAFTNGSITLKIGNLSKTFSSPEDFGIFNLPDGNQVEVINLFDYIGDMPIAKIKAQVKEKIRIHNKCEEIFAFIKGWEEENPEDDLSDLAELCGEMAEYNMGPKASEKALLKLQKMLEALKQDGVTAEHISEWTVLLKEAWEQHKQNAKEEKYTEGLIPFKDVDDTDEAWYSEFVKNMAGLGIIEGYKSSTGTPLGEFRPSNNVTVAEILKIALITAGYEPTSTGSGNIPAVWAGHWAENYYNKGISLGLAILENDAGPNSAATRGQVIHLILEAFGFDVPDAAGSPYSDVPLTHPEADWIIYATELEIVSGDTGRTTFRPNSQVNRAEVSKIINNVLELLSEEVVE